MLSRHSAMDVMPLFPGHALNISDFQDVSPLSPNSLDLLSLNTLLRPVNLGGGDSFSAYLTGVELPTLAGMAEGAAIAQGTATFSPVVGQYFDQDFLGDMGKVWNNFVESGQLWALLFGIVIGYMVRNLTAF